MTKLLLAASMAVLVAGPAFAQGDRSLQVRGDPALSEPPPTRAIPTGWMDFNNREQMRLLFVRLQSAAAAVCDPGSNGGPARPWAVDQTCLRQALAQAVRSADKPVLTAMYNARVGDQRAFAGNEQ